MPERSVLVVVLLFVLAFSLLVLNFYEINYDWMASKVRFTAQGCSRVIIAAGLSNCLIVNAAITVSKLEMNTQPEHSSQRSIASQLALFRELTFKGRGRRGGGKMNISLIAAYEFEDLIVVTMTSTGKYADTVYCRYFDHVRRETGGVFKSIVFPEYTVYCAVRKGAKYMSLSNTPNETIQHSVPIVSRTQKEPTHFFSICLAPIYGSEPKWLALAELIEHYKLQGATYFYVYVHYMDEYSRILLDDYIRTGEAEAIILQDRFSRNDANWQSVEILDCLVRARGHSRWAAFVDLDEKLTMTDYQGTLSDYLKNVTDPSIGSLQFRQRWILKNDSLPAKYIDKKQLTDWMPTRRYHNTSHVGPPSHTSKCIIDPKKDKDRTYIMKPEEGVVRHYRDVNSGNWGRTWLKSVEKFGNFSMTDYPKSFMENLTTNIYQRVHSVYGM